MVLKDVQHAQRLGTAQSSKSARYNNVQARLDTGPNMRKILAQYEGTGGPNARPKQQNEFYAKLKPLTLAELLKSSMDQEESVYKIDRDDACSMISSIVPSEAGTEAAANEGNLLLLDVRSYEEYDQCHIFGARHYDPAQLSKATNNFPRELYYFKGPMGGDKMVVLYDEDGKGIKDIANTFVERGVENTYVLSGGLLGAAYRCPQLLVGEAPSDDAIIAGLQLKPQPQGLAGAGLGRCSTAGSTRTQQTSLSFAGSEAPIGRPWK